VDEDKTT